MKAEVLLTCSQFKLKYCRSVSKIGAEQMTKVVSKSVVLTLACLFLGGCASQSVDRMRIKQAEKQPIAANNVKIYCSGAQSCEFERFDKQEIVNATTQRVNRDAIQKGYVHLVDNSFKDKGLYLTVPSTQAELVVRFYPISNKHAEVFHLIHNFKAKQNYTLKMYRKRFMTPGSLLSVSAPMPLCVDLLQAQKTIRRFCRPYDVLTGISEFVEQKI